MNYKPVIIIGAPRSGTNMLRDVLCKLPGVGSWPCDEINYIWRHGNIAVNTDEFSPDLARPGEIRYIRKKFDCLAKKNNLDFVVEKTCANSLRVPFVDKIFPDARYVFIFRNGIDVLASAQLRWKASLDLKYIFEKVRYVPAIDLPYYGVRYLWSRLYRFFSKEDRLAFWGPQLSNMGTLLSQYSLEQVCALQWKKCVESADHALSKLPENRVVRVQYESFVRNPREEIERIVRGLNLPYEGNRLDDAVSGVLRTSVGKGKKQLDPNVYDSLKPLISETLANYGY